MAKIKHSNGIEVEGYSSLAEYTIPQRPEYLTLVLLRMKLLEMKSLQEAYDYVQDEIVKNRKTRTIKRRTKNNEDRHGRKKIGGHFRWVHC